MGIGQYLEYLVIELYKIGAIISDFGLGGEFRPPPIGDS